MKNLTTFNFILIFTVLLSSCKKEYDTPTLKTIPVGDVKTISEVRAMYVPGEEVKITQDISVYGVVTADETSGNLYKEAYMEDATGGLYMRFQSNSGLYIGDSIQLNLNGAKILKYNQMLQVDSLHADNSVKKISTQNFKEPETVGISTLLNNMEDYQAKLIKLNNVRFVEGGQGMTYADGDNQVSETRVLQNISGEMVDVRTSGYANFANDTLPAGSGTFIGVVAQYNSGLQLIIRAPSELAMDGALPVEIVKDFDDQSLTSGGWTTHHLSGPSYTAWDIFASTNSAAKVTCYNSSTMMGEVSDAWLVSPALDLSSSGSPIFNFRNVVRYGLTPVLEVLVSTDYDGVSSPTTATWTNLTSQALWDTDDSSWSTWTSSGDIDLSPYKTGATFIAFRHQGQNISGVPTWEIDDIRIIK